VGGTALPSGGVKDQVLTKLSPADQDAGWVNLPVPSTAGKVPDGGTTNQVLTKLSNANQNTGWTTPASGGSNYVHPTGDGNLHVPATGTSNNAKRLTAGASAGSLTWTRPGIYQGTWNASTNSPALVSGSGTADDFYTVGTAGSTDIDGTAAWVVGDQIRFNGSIWQKVPAPPAGAGGGAPAYVHPTGDGNLHVPATGTTNNGKVLTAGSSAGSLSWQTPAAGGGGGGAFLLPDLVTLGGVGDGVTSNDAAFTAAEAHASPVIWIPPGTFVTSKTDLTKRYTGAGKIKLGSGTAFDDVAFVRTRVPPSLYYDGATGRMNGSWTAIGTPATANLRNGWSSAMHTDGGQTNTYFDAAVTPYHVVFDNYGGHAGKSAVLNTPANNGANSIQVQGPGAEVVVGAKIRMWGDNYSDYTVTSVTSAGGSNANLGLNRAVYNGPYPAYYSYVTISDRTMSTAYYTEVAHRGGGDSYVHVGNMVVTNQYNKNAGQSYFMNTATGGLFGGSMYGDGPSIFLTAYEVQYSHNPNYNIAVCHEPIAFDRQKNDDSGDCRWFGNWFKSPYMAMDAAYFLNGNFKVGFDTVNAAHTVSGSAQPFAAINMGTNQRHYYNSIATSSNFGYYYNGNWFGDCYRRHNGSNNTLEDFVSGSPALAQGATATQMKRVLVCERDVEHHGQVVNASDERLKENVRDMPGGLNVVDGLHPVIFDWIGEGKKDDLGLIAQEVQAIAPELVVQTKSEEGYLAVDYSKGVVMHLVLAVQQLSDKVAALEAVLAAKG
jgi:hypothetical protein